MDNGEEKILKSWLQELRSRFSQSQEIVEPQVAIAELSNSLQKELREIVGNLSTPPSYRDRIAQAVRSAVEQWRDRPHAPNSLVILSAPVEPIESLLKEVVEEVSRSQNLPLQLLELSEAPTIHPEGQVKEFLARLNSKPQFLSVPSLSSCFLRCIGGLDGIELLRETVFTNRECFWVIGCNSWAWQYLEETHSIEADFGATFDLSPLDEDELRQWLQPALKKVPLQAEPQKEVSYFVRLADLSNGLSQVAGQLWLDSLSCETDEESEEPVCRSKLTLPKLSTLKMSDRYLLYSLLLHEKLALPQMALSLGEPEGELRRTVLQLQQKGLVWQQQDFFRINPLHYSKLKVDLVQNSFPIEL